jgi:hypothetical protein
MRELRTIMKNTPEEWLMIGLGSFLCALLIMFLVAGGSKASNAQSMGNQPTVMVIWGEGVQKGGLTSEIVIYQQCLNVKEQASGKWSSDFKVYCYPLDIKLDK